MTLETAIILLKKTYEIAQAIEEIKNPLAYALYHTWKQADGKWGEV